MEEGIYYPFNVRRKTLHTPERIRQLKKAESETNSIYGGHLDDCVFSALYLMQEDSYAAKNPYSSVLRTVFNAPAEMTSKVLFLREKISGPSLRQARRGLSSWGLLDRWDVFMREEYYEVCIEGLL